MFNKILLRLMRIPGRVSSVLHHIESCNNIVCGPGSRFYPSSQIDNIRGVREAITVGSGTHVLGQLLVFANGGSIKIGDSCYIGDHTRIWSMTSISVGNRVLISHGVNIHDSVSHSSSADERHRHFVELFCGDGHPKVLTGVATEPVEIQDDAWIGFNATILKGVTIGRGAVVGACSVVTQNVAPYTIVVGNPARIVGQSKP